MDGNEPSHVYYDEAWPPIIDLSKLEGVELTEWQKHVRESFLLEPAHIRGPGRRITINRKSENWYDNMPIEDFLDIVNDETSPSFTRHHQLRRIRQAALDDEKQYGLGYAFNKLLTRLEGLSMAKTIMVDKENFRRLESQYNLEEDYLTDKFGFFMLVVFGFEQVEGYLSKEKLDAGWRKTRDLENGWWEVIPID